MALAAYSATMDRQKHMAAATAGAAEAIPQADLAEGDMVTVITKEDGSQTVMVLEYDASDTTDTADDSSSDAGTESEAVEEAAGE